MTSQIWLLNWRTAFKSHKIIGLTIRLAKVCGWEKGLLNSFLYWTLYIKNQALLTTVHAYCHTLISAPGGLSILRTTEVSIWNPSILFPLYLFFWLILICILSQKETVIVSIYIHIYIYMYIHIHQRRQWHPTPVLLPGKSHGRRSLVGCSPWGC